MPHIRLWQADETGKTGRVRRINTNMVNSMGWRRNYRFIFLNFNFGAVPIRRRNRNGYDLIESLVPRIINTLHNWTAEGLHIDSHHHPSILLKDRKFCRPTVIRHSTAQSITIFVVIHWVSLNTFAEEQGHYSSRGFNNRQSVGGWRHNGGRGRRRKSITVAAAHNPEW